VSKKNKERRQRRIIGLAFIVSALLFGVLLALHAWAILRAEGAPPSRAVGVLGGAVAGFLWRSFGLISLLIPVALGFAGFAVLTLRERRRILLELALLLGIGALVAAFFHAAPGFSPEADAFLGGWAGASLHGLIVKLIGDTSAFLLLGGALLLVIVALIDFEVPGPGPIVPFVAGVGRRALALVAAPFRSEGGAARGSTGDSGKPPRAARAPDEAGGVALRGERTAARGVARGGALDERDRAADMGARRREAQDPLAREAAPMQPRVPIFDDAPEPRALRSERPLGAPRSPTAAGDAPSLASARTGAHGDGDRAATGAAYTLPPLDLLADPNESGPTISKEQLLEHSRTLESKLADFGVRASVTEVHPGPVITRYELEPAPGIKVGQIANLADDLALAMRAKRIRIVAPIPGKGAVGVEIPNPEARMVFLKEVLTSPAFQDSRSPLTIALGKDIAGKAFVTTLEEMPHLLLAGATGSGKSVSMHVLISSILFKALPSDVRFIMIDPKMLELAVYNDIPHLIRPVVTEPREAAKALRWVIDEMERRYKTLARVGVRNIAGFNEWLAKSADKSWGEDAAPKPLPLLVVVIDEYADLVLTLGSEVEEPIAKLAQMARAVGIHLVVATQRPSVDVITGVIKANFPSRIAFQVASKVDSRTIMDVNGAEKLLGRGDMLFLKTGRPEAERVHGAFISNEETTAIADFIKEQRYKVEQEAMAAEEEEDNRPFDGNAEDELFEEAVKLVVRHQFASVSMLQRRLKVGFSRAGRLMDLMERAGIVGANEGSKAREVFMKPSEMAHVEADLDE
jgi:DNA segregation ATPase FtsK/SpoIIIE-like protein